MSRKAKTQKLLEAFSEGYPIVKCMDIEVFSSELKLFKAKFAILNFTTTGDKMTPDGNRQLKVLVTHTDACK